MTADSSSHNKPENILGFLASTLGRILISVFVPLVTFIVLWQGFMFLRDSQAPQVVIVLVAILWGVGGVAALFFVANWVTEQLPKKWTHVYNRLSS